MIEDDVHDFFHERDTLALRRMRWIQPNELFPIRSNATKTNPRPVVRVVE